MKFRLSRYAPAAFASGGLRRGSDWTCARDLRCRPFGEAFDATVYLRVEDALIQVILAFVAEAGGPVRIGPSDDRAASRPRRRRFSPRDWVQADLQEVRLARLHLNWDIVQFDAPSAEDLETCCRLALRDALDLKLRGPGFAVHFDQHMLVGIVTRRAPAGVFALAAGLGLNLEPIERSDLSCEITWDNPDPEALLPRMEALSAAPSDLVAWLQVGADVSSYAAHLLRGYGRARLGLRREEARRRRAVFLRYYAQTVRDARLSWWNRRPCLEVWARLDPGAIPTVYEHLLQGSLPHRRRESLAVLDLLRRDPPTLRRAMGLFLDAVEHPWPPLAETAVRALRSLGPAALDEPRTDAAAPGGRGAGRRIATPRDAIAAAMAHPNALVREAAVCTASRLGVARSPAVEQLADADPDPRVRRQAARALGRPSPGARSSGRPGG